MKNKFGFIILRHVESKKHDKLWKECYDCIRKYYKDNLIVILDDNSDYSIVTKKELKNTIVVDSEYKKRGELLPYLYFLKNSWFDTAVIVHDSVFLQKRIRRNLSHIDDVLFLWHFPNYHAENFIGQEKIIKTLRNNEDILDFHRKKQNWVGCFGVMTIIRKDFLIQVDKKYNLFGMVDVVQCRDDRMCLERVLGCLFSKEKKKEEKSMLGNVVQNENIIWGLDFDKYSLFLKNKKNPLSIIKVFSSR